MFYNKRQILSNLSLEIHKQEILGMLGPNALYLLFFILQIEDPSFKVLIDGIDCTNIPIYERAKNLKLICPTIWWFYTRFNSLENLN